MKADDNIRIAQLYPKWLFAAVKVRQLRSRSWRTKCNVSVDDRTTALADNGSFVRLPGTNSLNFPAFWKVIEFSDAGKLTLTASIDNATDSIILPQIGLPAPGRIFRIGLRPTS